jgi:hypothetical protein
MQHPPQIEVGAITSPNPSLWMNMITLERPVTNYRIATETPGESWMCVNQFCSLLALRWLQEKTHGISSSPYGLSNFLDTEKITMAQQLINCADLDAQVTFAIQELGGSRKTLDQVATGVEEGAYAVGTRIWAGNDHHVIAIYLESATTYMLYDPDTGITTREQRADFRTLMAAFQNNAFVCH